jgi:DNA-binding CsgD family transcriptional regulator
MDWAAIASLLGERSDRPIVLLDKDGRIRMFNRAIEQVLGWRRFEVEGELWARACTPPGGFADAQRWIADALRGALWSFETIALTNSRSETVLRFEFSLVGAEATQGVLATVTNWKPVEPAKPIIAGHDLDYDIATDPSTFGALMRLTVDADRIRPPGDNSRCFAVIHGLVKPCEQCPVLRNDDARWPRVFVRHVMQGGSAAFEIKSADRIESGLVRIRTRTVNQYTLEAIHAAKIEQIAERADLSAREREILAYLVLGRSIEDISTLVGIAVRTVKYHQANLLQKLGADSRSDLMRVLF